MLSSLFGLSSEVIQISKDDVRKIMKNIGHGLWNIAPTFLSPKGMT